MYKNFILLSIFMIILLSNFVVPFKFYYLYIGLHFYGLIYLISKKGNIEKWIVYVGFVICFFNLASSISGYIKYDIGFNYSFIFQYLALILIIISIYYLCKNHKSQLDELLYYTFYACLCLLIVQFYYGIQFESYFDKYFLTGKILEASTSYSNQAALKIGLKKGLIVWSTFFLLIYNRHRLKKSLFNFFLFLILFLTFMAGVKATLLGQISIILLLIILSINLKIVRFIILFFSITSIIFFGILNIKKFDEYTSNNSRYFVPIFTSSDFWTTPFGIGRGNYPESTYKKIFNLNFNYTSEASRRYFEKTQNYQLPNGESDTIILATEMGWIFYFILLLFLIWVLLNLIINKNINNKIAQQGSLLLIYLFITSIMQDYLFTPSSLIFYSLALSLIFSTDKHNKFLKTKAHIK